MPLTGSTKSPLPHAQLVPKREPPVAARLRAAKVDTTPLQRDPECAAGRHTGRRNPGHGATPASITQPLDRGVDPACEDAGTTLGFAERAPGDAPPTSCFGIPAGPGLEESSAFEAAGTAFESAR